MTSFQTCLRPLKALVLVRTGPEIDCACFVEEAAKTALQQWDGYVAVECYLWSSLGVTRT